MVKIAIIGSGLAGISTALLLKDQADITLFEKARGVSGRMSTRIADPYLFDHGAQYFTVRTDAFRSFVHPLLEAGVVARWNANYVELDRDKIIKYKDWANEEPRYVGVPRMNSINKYLARNLKIKVNTRIKKLEKGESWSLLDDEGNKYSKYDWVITAIPPLQVAELLPDSFKYYEDIKNIEMYPSFSLMLGFEKEVKIKFDAAKIINSDISWVSIDSRKPFRNNCFALIAQSSAEYALQNIRRDKTHVMEYLIQETSDVLSQDLKSAVHKNIHGWLYANAVDEGKNVEFFDIDEKLAVCGDWCCGGRVEGAFLSAYNLAKIFKEQYF